MKYPDAEDLMAPKIPLGDLKTNDSVLNYTKPYLFFVTFCHRVHRDHRDVFSAPKSSLCALCDLCGSHIEFQITLAE